MSARIPVIVPTLFMKSTGGIGRLEIEANSVRVLLDELIARYPQLKAQVFDAKNAQQRFLNIFVNGLDVRFIDGLDSKLSDGDEVQLVPAIAGG